MQLNQALAVMLGGALGALARYATSAYFSQFKSGLYVYPIATLSVNVVGCFLLSLLVFSTLSNVSPTLKLALGTGFLGALTTFSTFELDSYRLMQEQQWGWVGVYLFGNLLLGFAAILLGRLAAQRLL